MAEWYVYDGVAERGPFSDDAFFAYLKGKDPARIKVWREGLDAWVPAKSIPALVTIMQPVPEQTPAPPLAATREPAAATAAAPVDIIVGAVDRFAQIAEQDDVPQKESKWLWAMCGALIGAAWGALHVVLNRIVPSPMRWSTDIVAHIVAYSLLVISGRVILCAILGFVAGCIRDAFRAGTERAPAPFTASPSTDPAISPGSVDASVKRHRFNNVIARHWRGELPLWVSYWVMTFVAGNLLAGAISIASNAYTPELYYPPAIFAAMVAVWIVVVAYSIWQNTGLWRSASNYSAARAAIGRHTIAAKLAKAVVVISVVFIMAIFTMEGVPQLRTTYRIAFAGDPEVPPYAIRVVRDGTEAEISGGFKYGLTKDFERVLLASPRIKTVHLDSIGGRVGEATKMFNLIRERGLNTSVAAKCASACTLAFAGGRERLLVKGATLGFHRGAVLGREEPGLDKEQLGVFRQAGFDPVFIGRALSTPHKDMWQPSADVLLDAKVVTKVVAQEAPDNTSAKDDLTARMHQAMPFVVALKQRFPKVYDALANGVYKDYSRGKPEAEILRTFRTRAWKIIRAMIPMADDEVLLDLNRIQIEQYSTLGRRDPSVCYQFGTGAGDFSDFQSGSDDLFAREQAVYARAVSTAAKRPALNADVVDRLMQAVDARLRSNGLSAGLLSARDLEPRQHRSYCEAVTMFYREVGQLPSADAVILLRSLHGSKDDQ